MIADQLREKLSITKTVHSMFSTLLHFKSLFMWPHVRGVIAEHRWKLLQKVRDEIKIIHQKVKVRKCLPHCTFTCVLLFPT